MNQLNQRRLFIASCLALVATSMAFSIRADIIPAMKTDFGLTDAQMGAAAGPGLWAFSITIVLGGILVDWVGMGPLMVFAFFGHVLGTVLTIFSTGFSSLYFATLLIGLSNGMVEAVANPLTATLFPDNKSKYLNMLHAWWPGGLIIGGLLSYGITKTFGLNVSGISLSALSIGWKIKMALILLPTLGYGYLMLGQKFPQTERVATGVSTGEMFREAIRPMFLLLLVLMMATSATELGPKQWVGNLLQNLVGIQGVLLLVYTAGLMFILRQFFAGAFLERLSPLGVLTFASILSCIGLFGLSSARTGLAVFLAATVFGIGKTYFWPTMIGVVSERFPKGGALLMGLMGGAGMFSAGWLATPIMGSIQDHYAVNQLSEHARDLVVSHGGIDERKAMDVVDADVVREIEGARQYSAAMTYRWVAVVPAILTLIFGLLYLAFRAAGGYSAVRISRASPLAPSV
jgi:MFS family permease